MTGTNPSDTRDSELVARLRAMSVEPPFDDAQGFPPRVCRELMREAADTIDRLTSTGEADTADVSVLPSDNNSDYVRLVVQPKHSARQEYRISIGAADVLFYELAGMADIAASPREGHVEVPLFSKEAIEDFQFLAQMQVGIRDCIGLDREKLTIAKRLRDKGYVTIADSAQGPMVELTEAGAVKALERFATLPHNQGETKP